MSTSSAFPGSRIHSATLLGPACASLHSACCVTCVIPTTSKNIAGNATCLRSLALMGPRCICTSTKTAHAIRPRRSAEFRLRSVLQSLIVLEPAQYLHLRPRSMTSKIGSTDSFTEVLPEDEMKELMIDGVLLAKRAIETTSADPQNKNNLLIQH